MDEKVTKEQLDQLTASMGEVVGEEGEGKELMDSIATLLALPDEQFEILAPGILQSYSQTFNNPNDKLALVQTLNATGYKAEDVNAAFNELVEAVDKMELPVAKRNFLKQMFGFIIGAINETEGISKRYIPIAIELCHPDAKIPQYAHISDSGVDVYAVEDIPSILVRQFLYRPALRSAFLRAMNFRCAPKAAAPSKPNFGLQTLLEQLIRSTVTKSRLLLKILRRPLNISVITIMPMVQFALNPLYMAPMLSFQRVRSSVN